VLGRAEAHAALAEAARKATAEGRPFADVLAADPAIARVLDRQAIERLLSPGDYLGAAPAFIEEALADYDRDR
jgi:adenylosuccinate lyase